MMGTFVYVMLNHTAVYSLSVYRRVPGSREMPHRVTLLGRNPRILESRIAEQCDSMIHIQKEPGSNADGERRWRLPDGKFVGPTVFWFEVGSRNVMTIKTTVDKEPKNKSGQLIYCEAGRRLTFRHRASCILGQAFHYSPQNAFYIFNQQIYFIIWYLFDRASLI